MSNERNAVLPEDLAVGQVWRAVGGADNTVHCIEGGFVAVSWITRGGLLARGYRLDVFAGAFAKHLISIDGEPAVHYAHRQCPAESPDCGDQSEVMRDITCPVCLRRASEAEAELPPWREMEVGEVICAGDESCGAGIGLWGPSNSVGCTVKAVRCYHTRRPKPEPPRWEDEPGTDRAAYEVATERENAAACPLSLSGRSFAGWEYANGQVSMIGPVAYEWYGCEYADSHLDHYPAGAGSNWECRVVIAVRARYERIDIAAAQAEREVGR